MISWSKIFIRDYYAFCEYGGLYTHNSFSMEEWIRMNWRKRQAAGSLNEVSDARKWVPARKCNFVE